VVFYIPVSDALAGDSAGAAEAFKTTQELMPGPSREFLATNYPFADPDNYAFIEAGFRMCGWTGS
jgi:hypothetical protein